MNGETIPSFLCPHCGKRHPMEEKACPATGTPIEAHQRLLGNVLEGKYAIEKIIGQGGMGVVYRARHTLIGRKLAIKVLASEVASHPEIVQRFYNEARTAASIGDEHVIEITDMGTHGGSPFIVMEYLDGESLAFYLKSHRVSIGDAAGITVQVLTTLSAVHDKGVIHRDLKPDNIFLVSKPGRRFFIKILDFGISKLKVAETQNMGLTRTGTVMGTPYYMSPEQAMGVGTRGLRIIGGTRRKHPLRYRLSEAHWTRAPLSSR
jgi:serine/threonine protein kinase